MAEVKDHSGVVISGGKAFSCLICEINTKPFIPRFLLALGIDGNLIINKVNGFGMKPPLKVVPFPQVSQNFFKYCPIPNLSYDNFYFVSVSYTVSCC